MSLVKIKQTFYLQIKKMLCIIKHASRNERPNERTSERANERTNERTNEKSQASSDLRGCFYGVGGMGRLQGRHVRFYRGIYIRMFFMDNFTRDTLQNQDNISRESGTVRVFTW